jgi:hypothetical protein
MSAHDLIVLHNLVGKVVHLEPNPPSALGPSLTDIPAQAVLLALKLYPNATVTLYLDTRPFMNNPSSRLYETRDFLLNELNNPQDPLCLDFTDVVKELKILGHHQQFDKTYTHIKPGNLACLVSVFPLLHGHLEWINAPLSQPYAREARAHLPPTLL